MSQIGYTETQHSDPLHEHHRRMLEVESGISPDIIAARGWRSVDSPAELRALGFADYQCRPGLVVPEWTTAGVQRGYKLRPDNPRSGKTGKPVKYESPAGTRLHLDCPPTMTRALRDPTIPLYFTEGSKKADAAASHGLPCVSMSGVYGFMHGRLTLDDLDDIALDGRDVRVAFDNDVTVNPKVADAMHRLCGALDRRGARVSIVTLPPGEKVGLDDYLANGGTVAGLDALTTRWQSRAPLEAPEPAPDTDRDAVYWQRRAEDAERRYAAVVHVLRNADAKDTEKRVMVSSLALAAHKASRGEVEPDGRVRLEPRHIANDHRKDPKKTGGKLAERNPTDGSRPLARRAHVAKILKSAAAAGILSGYDVEKVSRQNPDGTWTQYPEILIDPPRITEALEKLAAYVPADAKPRAAWGSLQKPCPHCGEKHERAVICLGCGVEAENRRNQADPAPPPADDDVTEPDAPETLRTQNVRSKDGPFSPSPAPLSIERTQNVRSPIREDIDQRTTDATPPPSALPLNDGPPDERDAFNQHWMWQ